MIPVALVALAWLFLPTAPKPQRWVFPTPLGSRRGVRVFGENDTLIVERLVRL